MKKLNLSVVTLFLLGITTANAQDPTLYGMTNQGGGVGNIFKFKPNPVSFTNEYNLQGTNGGFPLYGPMIQATDGNLYGVVDAGGAHNEGCIFRYNPVTNTYTDLLDFTGTSGPYTGKGAFGNLIQANDGNLYGMTEGGGAPGFGNIFRYNISTNTYTDLVDFTGGTGAYPGSNPHGGLYQASDGKLYGMLAEGLFVNQYGKLFSYDIGTSTYTVLFSFTYNTGAYLGRFPVGNVMQATDGNLYGMTENGATSYGNIFRYNPNTTAYTDLVEFTGDAGAYPGYYPEGSLMQASDGNIYGMTNQGGASHDGNIFKYNPTTSTYSDLVDFTGTTGAYIGDAPYGSLMQATDGNLYGMTSEEYYADGNIFQYNPNTSTYTDIFDFSGISYNSNGLQPEGDLMEYYFTTITVTSNVTCYGYDNGNVTANPSGGTSPYTYSWSNGTSTVSTSTPTGAILSAGSYTLTVTDNKGRTATASATITQPPALFRDSVATLANVGCHGGNGGSAKIGVKGSVGPYTYQWAPNTNYTASATGLTAGTYTVTVTSKYGCSNALLVTITQPAVLHDSLVSITYPTCNGEKGDITIGVTGGNTPYNYFWTEGVSTTATATNISSRTYTITIHDKYDCAIAPLVINLTQPNAIRDSSISSLKANVSCHGANDGTITIGVKYGTAPYTFIWNPNVSATSTATGLSAGVYSVTITDNKGCSGTTATTITQPATVLTATIGTISCFSNLVRATVTPAGGTSPYTYSWSPGGGTKTTMSNLAPGTYTITVTDKHGCTYSITPNLVCPPEIKDKLEGPGSQSNCCAGLEDINLYPNPNRGQFTLSGLEKGMTVEMYDYTGRKISSISASDINMVLNISDQPNGIYLIRISNKDGTLIGQKKVVKTN